MMWGFVKKMVVADRLAMFADVVFNDPAQYHGITVIWAMIFFTFQIYCDFSGYSDIALGASRIMGIELMVNFNVPYISTSIKDFWSRWHISLSTWFRDYFYISLGGNRVSKVRWYFNVFAVFLVSGLWHGANWTFIVWGALHGTFQVFGHLTASLQETIKAQLKPLRFAITGLEWVFTMVLVTIAWVFFRANNIGDAFTILKQAPQIERGVMFGIPMFSTFFNLSCVAAIIIMFAVEFVFSKKWQDRILPSGPRPMLLDVLYCAVLFLCIYVFGIFEEQSFIYFQF
jgi:D-alanyl-lipoteichoic acid acyltransferase DltB (MBOAT superfamily)